ncbi:hypothetical protein BC629DRAFT_1525970 [Irpex lacteus]|nr:hypothetical protein BC629DRAFT_1525970 [Irpex lacteus]
MPAQASPTSDVCLYFLALFIPPLTVFFNFWINILLWILGWIPGVLHAWLAFRRLIITCYSRLTFPSNPGIYLEKRGSHVIAQLNDLNLHPFCTSILLSLTTSIFSPKKSGIIIQII